MKREFHEIYERYSSDLYSFIEVGAQREITFDGQKTRSLFGFRTDMDFNFIMESYYIDIEEIAELREFIVTAQ